MSVHPSTAPELLLCVSSQIAACTCHELLSPAPCPVGISKRHVHLNSLTDKTQTTATLGFVGQRRIARGQSHQFHQFQIADIKRSPVLKVTCLEAAPDQLAILEACAPTAIESSLMLCERLALQTV